MRTKLVVVLEKTHAEKYVGDKIYVETDFTQNTKSTLERDGSEKQLSQNSKNEKHPMQTLDSGFRRQNFSKKFKKSKTPKLTTSKHSNRKV